MVARVFDVTEVLVDFTFSDGDHAPLLKVYAKGHVNTGGWSNPELGVWSYIAEPNDGVLDLDFMATPPAEGTIVTMAFTNVSAALLLPIPDWVKGVRVHASTNQMEAMLSATLPTSKSSEVKTVAGGLPLPWPFPWYVPAKAAETGKWGD
ncbi:hypothetical protein NKY68_00200 [Sinorhizobium meliloti]|uniref:hypothetical protein n=1 Tax=Rhizobium meliloti TaxID=382 RepID=UPI003D6465D9